MKIKKNRIIFIILVLVFLAAFALVALIDLNLHIFGEGALISKAIINTIVFALFLAWVLLIVFYYFKFTREYKVSYKEEYCDTIPFSYSPVIMKNLGSLTKINSTEIMGLIAYFCSSNYVSVVIDNKDENVFHLEKVINHDDALVISNHERYLLEWLFDDMGDGNQISYSILANYLSIEENKDKFQKKYEQFNEIAKQDIESYNFFFKYKGAKKTGKMSGILFMILSLVLAFVFDKPVFFIFYFLGIVLFAFAKRITRRTPAGQKQFEIWMAYKRYLMADFDESNEKINDIDKIKKELPYIVAFDMYKSVREKILMDLSENQEKAVESDILKNEMLFFEQIYGLIDDNIIE